MRVTDPYAASYGVLDAIYAISQLAQTTMRSEIGKITLDKTFEERDSLNQHIVNSINVASKAWGISCLRYEIRDISPPATVRQSMDSQASAERKKRTDILQSEGKRQAAINNAEGEKAEVVLNAEARAQAITMAAEAQSQAIERIAKAINEPGGLQAVSLSIAEQYIQAFSNIAKKGNTIILPADVNNIASMVSQSLGIFNHIQRNEGEQLKNTISERINENISNNNNQNNNNPNNSTNTTTSNNNSVLPSINELLKPNN